eukprot:1798586-Rhodomonas_salina.2
MVGSVNDYQKESQFRALNAKKDDMMGEGCRMQLRHGVTRVENADMTFLDLRVCDLENVGCSLHNFKMLLRLVHGVWFASGHL